MKGHDPGQDWKSAHMNFPFDIKYSFLDSDCYDLFSMLSNCIIKMKTDSVFVWFIYFSTGFALLNQIKLDRLLCIIELILANEMMPFYHSSFIDCTLMIYDFCFLVFFTRENQGFIVVFHSEHSQHRDTDIKISRSHYLRYCCGILL